MASEMLKKIRDLAEDMHYRREYGSEPYVLLLGSGITITPQVMITIVNSNSSEDDFFRTLSKIPAMRRQRELEQLWQQECPDLLSGYRALAILLKAHYFKLVITLNLDLFLDDALDDVGCRTRYRHVLTYGAHTGLSRENGSAPSAAPSTSIIARGFKLIRRDETSTREIIAALRMLPGDKMTIIRLYGRADVELLPVDNKSLYLDDRILKELRSLQQRDLIITGANEYIDDVIYETIGGLGKELWYVNSDISSASFLPISVKKRGGNFVTGEYGEFARFFITLRQQLQQMNGSA